MSAPLPELFGDTIYLRPYEPDDFNFFFELFSDPATSRHTDGPISAADAAGLFRKLADASCGDDIEAWVIVDKACQATLGHVAIKRMTPDPERELQVMIPADKWMRGYGTAACRLALEYAFRTAGYDKIMATVDPDHTAAIKLLKKLGFVLAYMGEDAQGRFPVHHLEREQWLRSNRQ